MTGLTGRFAINYEYYQSTGQLKKITDPFNDSISYAYDLAGRTTDITGSSYGGITNYVSGVTFRAGNQTKSLTSGTTTATMGYDSMLRVNNFQSGSINANYGYYSDNRLNQVTSPNNHLLDRYFDYNNPIGSLNYTSANGDTSANQYYLTMSHDYLGNQTSRGGRYWWQATGTTFSSSTQYLNNKIVSGSDGGSVTTSFDNEGNTLGISQGSTQTLGPDKFDAAGRIVAEVDPAISKYYDGDGNLVRSYNEYYLFSKVLGGKQLSIISATGTKTETSVFGNGQLLARQEIIGGGAQVTFVHRDPHNTIDYTTIGETKWVDAQGTTGKAATSTYISEYQAGVYGHPDPSFYAASSGQFYPGGGGNQKPGQSTVCTEDYVKVACNSLNMDARNGGLKSITIFQQGLNGYDEDSAKFVASARAAQGASINGSRSLIKRTVLPGTKTGIYIDGVLDESPDLEPKVIIEYISKVSADPVINAPQQQQGTPDSVLSKKKELEGVTFKLCQSFYTTNIPGDDKKPPSELNVAYVEVAVGEKNIELSAFTLSMWANESNFVSARLD